MSEHAASTPERARSRPYWLLPFYGRNGQSQPTYQPPTALPSNLEELIARLSNLETSFTAISSSAAADRSALHSASASLDESGRRLHLLEAEFEIEKRKVGKALQGSEKKGEKVAKEIEASLTGVRTQLEYLGEKVKMLSQGKKDEALQSARSQRDVEGLQHQVASLKNDLLSLGAELRGDFDRYSSEAGKGSADEQAILAAVSRKIEEMLPARLAVSLDPKSGEVQIDPKFWEHLKSVFPASAGNGKAGSAPNWEHFLASNRQSLHKLVDDTLEEKAHKGSVLSREAFLQILQKDLASLRTELSKASSDGLAKISAELSGKIGKLSSASAGKAQTIKLPAGEDLHAFVRTLVNSALDKYSKDVLARPDFALFSSGARVIPSLTSPTYEIRPSTWTGAVVSKLTGTGTLRGKPPVTALHPDINVGQCWPFAGQTGQLGVMLSRTILPTDVTIEHAAKDVALDVSSAPRHFEVWGLVEDADALQRMAQAAPAEAEARQANRLLLVSGEYDVSADRHVQTFQVPKEVQDLQVPVSVVLLRVLSNHDNEVLSCVYRLRVGGTLVEQQ